MLKIVIGIGLVLLLAGFMSNSVFADAPATPTTDPAVNSETPEPTTQAAGKLILVKNSDTKSLSELKNAGPDTSALLRQMMALIVVILVLGVGCWFVVKKGLPRFRMAGAAKPKDVSLLETTYLSPRNVVYLLQVGAKKLLVTGGKEGLRLLADVTEGFPQQLTDEEFETVLDRKKHDEESAE
ncbi:MAG: FliO/MopB family protein [Phycisphaerae bacterium]|nr:FliO/MopB family protein [Phycisphaerae bacterium]